MAREPRYSPVAVPTKQLRKTFCRINIWIPILFALTVSVPLIFMMGSSSSPKDLPKEESKETYMKYSPVTGYFEQDDPATKAKGYDFAEHNFCFIEREYDTDKSFDPDHQNTYWQRFYHHLDVLNEHAGPDIQYKVLYLGRHGEGYHNVAEAFYGTKAWDCYWSAKDGNNTLIWSDALLTPLGISQATHASTFWSHLTTTQLIPLPQSYYTSPLLRCLATAYHTFSPFPHSPSSPFIPVIKEMLREAIGVHTCDRRSSKTVIREAYPEWVFEEGFKEEDELWKAELRETDQARLPRARRALDDIWGGDENTHISISSHSGMIASLLEFIGHREFGLGTGQVIPVLVKGERVNGTLPPVGETPWEKVELCKEPPALPSRR